MSRTAVAVLSTENLLHNVKILKTKVQPAKIIAMVKANAYGHGIRSIGLRLDGQVDMLGVASIDEALALRKVGVKSPLILMQGIYEPNELLTASLEQFHVVFNNKAHLGWLDQYALPLPLQSWIKVNTGMGRLGFSIEEAQELYPQFLAHKNTAKPVRIMSHFSCADEIDNPINKQQIATFHTFIKDIKSEYSLCNSAGIFNFPNSYYDYVRSGIALYGVSPIQGKTGKDLNLKPVMRVQSSVMAVQTFKKGSHIGYGARYICPEDMPIGTVAFGYGDGYPLSAQDGTPILVNNVLCPLVGRISMDMITVDLRPCPHAKVGDPVQLWGDDLPVEHVTKYTATSTWDMLASVQNRVKFFWT